MKQTMFAKLAKKIVNVFSWHFFPGMRKSVFFWLFLLETNHFYLFCSRPCGCRFNFFIDGNRVLEGILDGIRFLLSNMFCKLGTECISMIPIPQNIFFWYTDCFQCPLGYKSRIIVVTETVIIYNTFIHISLFFHSSNKILIHWKLFFWY